MEIKKKNGFCRNVVAGVLVLLRMRGNIAVDPMPGGKKQGVDCFREGEKPSHKLWWMQCCSCVQVTKACRSTGVTDGVPFPGQLGATRPLVKQHLGRLFLHLGVKPECPAQPAVTVL